MNHVSKGVIYQQVLLFIYIFKQSELIEIVKKVSQGCKQTRYSVPQPVRWTIAFEVDQNVGRFVFNRPYNLSQSFNTNYVSQDTDVEGGHRPDNARLKVST